MPNGYWGRILRVDLSSGKISVEEQNEKFYRQYFGGWGIVAHYLLREVPAGCDPLSPENILVFAASVLTGTAIPGAGRNSAGAKSPLTGAIVELRAKGNLAYSEKIYISPAQPFAKEVTVPEGTQETDLKAILYDSDRNIVISYRKKGRPTHPL